MKDWVWQKNIVIQVNSPDTPQLNGATERLNRTLTTKALAMLVDSRLPQYFWEIKLNMLVMFIIGCLIRL